MISILFAIPLAAAVSVVVPASPPANSSRHLVAAPIGVSIEFFAFPEYMKLSNTHSCLDNLRQLTGSWPLLRVGGTTQDRATYDESLKEAVDYHVADSRNAPLSLTFGPSFMSLAGTYPGRTIIGLNRQLNQLGNTIAAAKQAIVKIDRLDAIELGNEPNFYGHSHSSPINTNGGKYTPSDDYTSQTYWQTALGQALSRTSLISAGVYFDNDRLGFTIASLAASEDESDAIRYVKDFSLHNYVYNKATANLANLQSHSKIAQQIARFKPEIAAANARNKPLIMGETNSATQGGGRISSKFGSALWLIDYTFQLLHLGISSIYFHHGTMGNCPYCWWGAQKLSATYYGAYFATLALAGADVIAPLDGFGDEFGVWGIYSNSKDGSSRVRKVLLYNSEFYDGKSGRRGQQEFRLGGLEVGESVYGIRVTAPSAMSETALGEEPRVGGRRFDGETCRLEGGEMEREYQVVDRHGWVTYTVAASEAMIVYIA